MNRNIYTHQALLNNDITMNRWGKRIQSLQYILLSISFLLQSLYGPLRCVFMQSKWFCKKPCFSFTSGNMKYTLPTGSQENMHIATVRVYLVTTTFRWFPVNMYTEKRVRCTLGACSAGGWSYTEQQNSTKRLLQHLTR